MIIFLSDLPAEANKPRLRVDKIVPQHISQLPDRYRTQCEEGFRLYPPHIAVHQFFLHYIQEGDTEPFMYPVCQSYQDNPFRECGQTSKRT